MNQSRNLVHGYKGKMFRGCRRSFSGDSTQISEVTQFRTQRLMCGPPHRFEHSYVVPTYSIYQKAREIQGHHSMRMMILIEIEEMEQ